MYAIRSYYAFQTHQSFFLGALLAARSHKIVEGDDLGADEPLLEVSVDDGSRLGGTGSGWNRPGTNLLDPGREIGNQTEQMVAGMDHPIEPRFVQTEFLQESTFFFVGQFGNFRLDLAADCSYNFV